MRVSSASFLLLCCFSFPATAQRASLAALLPADTSGWRLAEAPRSFVGDELFNMIDGGAALYREYGFDRAVSAQYQGSTGRTVDAEIYAMTDSAAASGIFGITAAAGEKALAIGDEGELGEYFLVFRKGRHVVTVSGQNSDKPTMDGVQLIGRSIESRLDSASEPPQLVREFSSLVEKGSRPVYLRGVIGVGNFYMFAPQNVFSVQEGVTGERDSVRFFVFCYPTVEESERNFRAAGNALHANEKYSGVDLSSNRIEATDRDGYLLRVSPVGNAIVVVIGRDDEANQKTESVVSKALGKL